MEFPCALDMLSKKSFSTFEEYFSGEKTFDDFLPELIKIYQRVLPLSPKMFYRVCICWGSKSSCEDFINIFSFYPANTSCITLDFNEGEKKFKEVLGSYQGRSFSFLIEHNELKKNNWLWKAVPLERDFIEKKLSEKKGILFLSPNNGIGFQCWIIAPDRWDLREGMFRLFELKDLPQKEVLIEFDSL